MGKCLLPLVVIGPSEVLTDLHSGLSRFSILNALDESQNGRFRGLKTEGGCCCVGAQGAPEVPAPPQHLCLNGVLPLSLSWVEFLAASLLSLEAGASICELFQVWSPPTQEPYNIF